MAARALQSALCDVLVVDKGRGVGGRMSTRRFDNHRLDHGAQFFTVRSDALREYVAQWQADGVVQEWCRGFRDAEDGHPRYRGSDGMNAIPKALAQGLEVRTEHKVTSAREVGNEWEISFEEQPPVRARALLITAPVPQTLAMLQAGGVTLPPATETALGRIEYDPCLALMVLPDVPLRMPSTGAFQWNCEPIQFMSDNARKGLPNPGQALTIHLAPKFSRQYWDAPAEAVLAEVQAHLSLQNISLQTSRYQLHRWRYSQPSVLHEANHLCAGTDAPLYFAGDAFAGPRVEGAALSGIAAGQALSQLFH